MSEETIKELESEIYDLKKEVHYLEDKVYDLEDDLRDEKRHSNSLIIELEELEDCRDMVEVVKELLEILAKHTNLDGSNPYRKLVEKYELSLKFPLVIRK